jgi:His-Xaa-Ser system radical SAM maturase HxsB
MYPFNLGRSFSPLGNYQPLDYDLLPFRFSELDDKRHVLTNLTGEYLVLKKELLPQIANRTLPHSSPIKNDLISRHFISEKNSKIHAEILAAKYRTKLAQFPDFTSLHIFVTTLRCDHTCQYCQVSRVSQDRSTFDMSPETAEKAVDMMFRSPSPHLKVEFQGGETLLNFELVKYIVNLVEARKEGRNIQYVITSNLANLTDEILYFAKQYDIYFSTSLDGPEILHNYNRHRPGNNAHAKTIEGVLRIREALNETAVLALMTTTAKSLESPKAIIDEYINQGFSSIFLRPLSPYGFAAKLQQKLNYQIDHFCEFYRNVLIYLIQLNQSGTYFCEEFTAMLLRRILTPFADGYINLQSPSGVGIMCLAYNYNGDVYSSDEGRMLAEMNDFTFRMGNLHQHTYEQIIRDSSLLEMLGETILEGTPQCTDCAFLPWCGSEPTYHYRTQGDFMGHRPSSSFCQRMTWIFKYLIGLLEDDPKAAKVLKSWI